MELKRFGVSIPENLLNRFDEVVKKKGYIGRSEAIRDAMRLYISQFDWEEQQEGALATFNVVFQHKPKLMSELIKAQHNSKVHVISSVHVHLTHSHCLEVISMEGNRKEIEKLTNTISGLSGVEYSRLFTFSLPEKSGLIHTH